MKKIALVLIALIVVAFTGCVWHGESNGEFKKTYCVGQHCITVWKTQNDSCYIIPGKYHGKSKPDKNFIETDDIEGFTIFFSDELPNALIYLGDDSIRVNSDSTFIFYNYNSNRQKFERILYPSNATKHRELKSNASLMDIFIEDNYATDKDGKTIE